MMSATRVLLIVMVMMTMTTTQLFINGAAPSSGDNGDSNPCEKELNRKIQGCFSSQGLQLSPSGSSSQSGPEHILKGTRTIDPEHQCQQKESYKAMANCTLRALKPCLALARMDGAIPDVVTFLQGVDFLCDRKDDLDAACLKTRYPDVILCGERTVKQLVENSQEQMADINDVLCLSAEVNYDCAREHLSTCGKDTVNIILQQLDKYHVPAACVDKNPGRPGRKRHNVTSGTKNLHSVSLSLSLASVVCLLIFGFLR